MPSRLLLRLLLGLLVAAPVSAQNTDAQFSLEKTAYVAGEPVFIVLTVSNRGNEPVWLDFKAGDFPLLCHDFAIEVPGAMSANERWGCGVFGSCGRSLKEVSPGKSLSIRELLNYQFHLQRLGTYAIHVRTTIVMFSQGLSDSPETGRLDVSDTLTVSVQSASENELKAAYVPIVKELDSSDPMRRGQAAGAIAELAPPFLEDVLIGLTKTNSAYAAIGGLRKANTVKTRDALAQIAASSDDRILQIQAIFNLGRTGDANRLPVLLRLMNSDDTQIQNAAAEAAGNLGGAAVIQQLMRLASSSDTDRRVAGANGLGCTHSNQAVPLLIELLLDPDASVREAAVGSLFLLTHHKAFDGNTRAEVATDLSAAAVHQRWVRWWNSHADNTQIHGMADCDSPKPLD